MRLNWAAIEKIAGVAKMARNQPLDDKQIASPSLANLTC